MHYDVEDFEPVRLFYAVKLSLAELKLLHLIQKFHLLYRGLHIDFLVNELNHVLENDFHRSGGLVSIDYHSG